MPHNFRDKRPIAMTPDFAFDNLITVDFACDNLIIVDR